MTCEVESAPCQYNARRNLVCRLILVKAVVRASGTYIILGFVAFPVEETTEDQDWNLFSSLAVIHDIVDLY